MRNFCKACERYCGALVYERGRLCDLCAGPTVRRGGVLRIDRAGLRAAAADIARRGRDTETALAYGDKRLARWIVPFRAMVIAGAVPVIDAPPEA